ncbi:unnamed protein product [Prorocentrum cordatum]|uniref:Uncharacterized protein n=1 Tax=Prorocentrum cordatum TaxID=2364126 RepID=A0ABN9RGA6_9DINO|nr:unnamed protein product [Polarella glacialis]
MNATPKVMNDYRRRARIALDSGWRRQLAGHSSQGVDVMLTHLENANPGAKLLATWMAARPEHGKFRGLRPKLLRAGLALKGWKQLAPGRSRKPFRVPVVARLVCALIFLGGLEVAPWVMVSFDLHLQPRERERETPIKAGAFADGLLHCGAPPYLAFMNGMFQVLCLLPQGQRLWGLGHPRALRAVEQASKLIGPGHIDVDGDLYIGANGSFDCTQGLDNWRKGWSEDKKDFCCDRFLLGCEFDCDSGMGNWQKGWSHAKKRWRPKSNTGAMEVEVETAAAGAGLEQAASAPSVLARAGGGSRDLGRAAPPSPLADDSWAGRLLAAAGVGPRPRPWRGALGLAASFGASPLFASRVVCFGCITARNWTVDMPSTNATEVPAWADLISATTGSATICAINSARTAVSEPGGGDGAARAESTAAAVARATAATVRLAPFARIAARTAASTRTHRLMSPVCNTLAIYMCWVVEWQILGVDRTLHKQVGGEVAAVAQLDVQGALKIGGAARSGAEAGGKRGCAAAPAPAAPPRDTDGDGVPDSEGPEGGPSLERRSPRGVFGDSWRCSLCPPVGLTAMLKRFFLSLVGTVLAVRWSFAGCWEPHALDTAYSPEGASAVLRNVGFFGLPGTGVRARLGVAHRAPSAPYHHNVLFGWARCRFVMKAGGCAIKINNNWFAKKDPDRDGDGVENGKDAFPSDRTEWYDLDGDGVGDNHDADKDGDGVPNERDRFPDDPHEWADLDGDGVGDNTDKDRDGDGVPNEKDKFPDDRHEWRDTDGDGIGDRSDTDMDGDGVPNVKDKFPLDPKEWGDIDGDGVGDNSDTDMDGDGIANGDDSVPQDPNKPPTIHDMDGDGIPDSEDHDRDGDGVPNSQDAFPGDPSEWGDIDGDGIGNSKDPDMDGDGIPNEEDKFPTDPSEWSDLDGDGIGDNKDNDRDGDGFSNNADAFPNDPERVAPPHSGGGGAEFEVVPTPGPAAAPAPAEVDSDGDGVPDSRDPAPRDPKCWQATCAVDSDGDGVTDINDPAPMDPTCWTKPCAVDSDGDGVADVHDPAPKDPKCWEDACAVDTDGDGIMDVNDPAPKDPKCWGKACAVDTDGDGIMDVNDPAPKDPKCWEKACAVDSDGDGIMDVNDPAPKDPKCWEKACAVDTDGDGIMDINDPAPKDPKCWEDACAVDADRDGIMDVNDPAPKDPKCWEKACAVDTDGDGIMDINDPAPKDPKCWEDACAVDSDGDGIMDVNDPAPKDPKCWEKACAVDTDGDGIMDINDPAPKDPKCWEDACAVDADGDGIMDVNDPAPKDPKCWEKACAVKACAVDTDGDGIMDVNDPAPKDPKCWEKACAVDSDGDGIMDLNDPAPHDPTCWELECSPAGLNKVRKPVPSKVYDDSGQDLNETEHVLPGNKTLTGDWREEWPVKEKETHDESISRICKEYPESAWCKDWLKK